MNANTTILADPQPDIWARSRLIITLLHGVDVEDFEEVCRVLIANRVSLYENVDAIGMAIDAIKYERECCGRSE